MAQSTVRLNRSDNSSWGFRLQGGKDFSTPVSIQRVNPGSIAEKAGLHAGDGILRISGNPTEHMKHKDAQDTIRGAGNNIELLVQRGAAQTWKPEVTPLDNLKGGPRADLSGGMSPMTKTSLAANKQDLGNIGSKHNIHPKPYAINGDRVLVHNQYNSPAGLYSMNNIAETLSAQAEVLNTGAVGINFMKENQPVNKDSAVYRMIQEEDKVPDGPVTRPVSAPVAIPPSEVSASLNQNICDGCGRLIVGVFVKVRDRPLHAECFKCCTCGSSLKNVGYHNINNKLYCSVHAADAARLNTPGNVSPIVVPLFSGAQRPKVPPMIPKKIGSPTSPSVEISSPIPFHGATSRPHHVDAPVSPSTKQSPLFAPSSQSSTTERYSSVKRQTTKSTIPSGHGMHPSTGPPVSARKPSPGGSRFTWPPTDGQPVSEDTTVTETTTTSYTSYRPPPETQKVQHKSKYLNQSPKTPPATSTKPIFAPKPAFKTPYAAPKSPVSDPWPSTLPSTTLPGSGFGARQTAGGAGSTPAPTRGRGTLTSQVAPGTRIPMCASCGSQIRGPFVTAMGKNWCPEHFTCDMTSCRRPLQDVGFVEEKDRIYCESCYEQHFAPTCTKCHRRIKGDCLNALDKPWHPDCFVCAHCKRPFGNSSFYMEDGNPYCETDWNDLFTTKCVGCGYAIEAGDKWVEALNNNYHSQCFKCSVCQANLEGQSFYAKGGKPYCKIHAR